jgi:quinol monooxygenase YgiN
MAQTLLSACALRSVLKPTTELGFVGTKERNMASAPVRMMLRWSVPPGESRPIVSALQGLMVSTRAEPGCAGCSLTTDFSSQVVINYSEDWNTEDDLKRQLRSHRFTVLAELMEHASERPAVKFALVDSVRGLDYAEEIRGVAQH